MKAAMCALQIETPVFILVEYSTFAQIHCYISLYLYFYLYLYSCSETCYEYFTVAQIHCYISLYVHPFPLLDRHLIAGFGGELHLAG